MTVRRFVLAAVLLPVAVAVSQPAGTGTVRVGLALSGGAALGMAHVGVLKVLEREGLAFVGITGNSMGSMVGGVYAAGYRAAQIESIAVSANWRRLFSSGVPFGARYLPERQQAERYVFQLRHENLLPSLPSGLVPLQHVEFLMMELLSDIEFNTGYDFDRLPVSFRAIAVDLKSGRLQVMKSGRLGQAIRASIAIPGVFAPERLDSLELVDGGVQRYLPVEELGDFRPDIVIASLTMKHNPETGISLIDIASRSMDVISIADLAGQRQLADIVIEPNVDPFLHSDFARAAGLIAAGESAATAALPEIRRLLAGRRTIAEYRPVDARALVTVRAVRFDGLKTTREAMLRPLVETRPGQYLVFSRLRRDMERVFNTGLFEDVNYRLEPAGESVDVTIELRERAYGFYYVGVRYDNADKLGLGFEVGQGNLWGSGAGVRAAAQVGNPNEYRLGLTGTRIFMLPMGYRLDAFWGTVERAWYDGGRWQAGYGTTFRGAVAEAGYILGRNAFFDVGLRGYQALYRLPALAVFDSLPEREWIAGPGFRLEYNDLDDLYIPTRGLRYRLDAFYSTPRIGASREFARFEADAERVLPLGSRLLVRPGWDFGLTLGAPAWNEYFRSAPENLPGFAKEEFTTRQKLTVRLGLDFRVVDLFPRIDSPLYARTFACLGTFRRLDRLLEQPSSFPDICHWSAGLGLLSNTPIGPVSLALGVADFARDRQDPVPRFNLHLAVGRDFRYTR